MSKLKKGTLSVDGKPTKFAVNLFLMYFELGGTIFDSKVNPEIECKIKETMGWNKKTGVLCLHWGLSENTKNSKKTGSYADTMEEAKNIAWILHTKCA